MSLQYLRPTRAVRPDASLNGEVAEPIVHLRAAGRSVDLPMSSLDLGSASTDHAVRKVLADYLEIPAELLDDHPVDRHANGNLTLRPPAVFG